MKRATITGTPVANSYAVLGVDPQATLDEIKTAYFALVRAHPPERDPEGFKRIRAAYEQLRDPDRRLETDMLRVQAWPEPSLAGLLEDAPLDLSLDPADVIRAARALSDLGRSDFREDYREVNV
jgi:curved DNA-binding protein CbpA